jgi:hypothetical protein
VSGIVAGAMERSTMAVSADTSTFRSCYRSFGALNPSNCLLKNLHNGIKIYIIIAIE